MRLMGLQLEAADGGRTEGSRTSWEQRGGRVVTGSISAYVGLIYGVRRTQKGGVPVCKHPWCDGTYTSVLNTYSPSY